MFHIDSTFSDDLNNGIFSEDLRQHFEKNGLSPSQTITVSVAEGTDCWRITDKNSGQIFFSMEVADRIDVFGVNFAETVTQRVNQCDLLLSLAEWYSKEYDLLLKGLAPMDSVGLFSSYSKEVKWREKANRSSHSVDISFLIPRYFNPSWLPENFADPPVLPSDCERLAERWRNAVPARLRVLAVHADTKKVKMWTPRSICSCSRQFFGASS